jgi:hypothetical protein
VTICVPAWRAEAFIERTLRCAREQTCSGICILVSVDRSDDATAAICRRHAREDGRIAVFEQGERLGWARNVNFLLDRVRTAFFFLYFHDDLIAPEYTEKLLQALRDRPDAMSAHCDMGHFGGRDDVSKGRNYTGSAAQRLGAFLVAPGRGSPLRSLIRSELLATGLRLPTDAVGGLWANEPFLMRLLAAGPAVRVPEVLYRRWDRRAGGLTDGWKTLTVDDMLAGFRANAATAMEIVRTVSASDREIEALTFCLHLQQMPRVMELRKRAGATLVRPQDIHPAFAGAHDPECLVELGPEIRRWALRRAARLGLLTGAGGAPGGGHAPEAADTPRA